VIVDDELVVTAEEFEAGTGWQLRVEGACLGDLCVPLRDVPTHPGANIDVQAIAAEMGMPLVQDAEHGLWALGPWPGSGRALASAHAPDLVLPDLDGTEFHLSSLRGQKVLLLAWAPY
jgi:hypothetical protein